MHVPDPYPDPIRPASAVSSGVGWAGLLGFIGSVLSARLLGVDGNWAALALLVGTALPMLGWSVFVDKEHLSPQTGLSLQPRRSLTEAQVTARVKLISLWITWGGIAGIYAVTRFYWEGSYRFAMEVLIGFAPFLFGASLPYLIWLDRRIDHPRDACWHFGAWLLEKPGWDWRQVALHLRSWGVKAFFLAFMLSILPDIYGLVVSTPTEALMTSPIALANWLISFLFLLDISIATIGYGLTLRPLNAHIRSVEPTVAGWVAALACYPPFHVTGDGRFIDYRPGTLGEDNWSYWFADYPSLLCFWAAMLVGLVAIYAWATLSFGLRFSNLTHRGILTHGPYALTKHPAYLAKNVFWWLACLPFLVTTGHISDAVRNAAGLMLVNAIYMWRARTEERHLSADPDYRAYTGWMAAYGPLGRLKAWISKRWVGSGRRSGSGV